MNRIEISEDARLDAMEAVLWYEMQKSGLGLEFQSAFEKTLELISNNPQHYQIRYKDVRICFLERFPYGVHFLSEVETVKILAVFHTVRNPENWQL